MSKSEKVEELIRKYRYTFVMNAIALVGFLLLELHTTVYLVAAVAIAVLSILVYRYDKGLGFHTITVAVSCCIAALYHQSSFGISLIKGEGNLSLVTIVLSVVVIELLYLLMEKLINGYSIRTGMVIISLLFGVGIIVVSYFLEQANPEYFSGGFYLMLLYGIIFFNSILSILFIKEEGNLPLLLMVSYGIIFVVIFVTVLSFVLEDGSLLELLVPDEWGGQKKKK